MNSSTPKRSEVDIRVAQEIKNQKDFIYQTNTTIQSLSNSLLGLSLALDQIKSRYGSDKKDLEISFENFRKEILQSSRKCSQDVSNSLLHLAEIEKMIQKSLYKYDECSFDIKTLIRLLESVNKRVYELEEKLERHENAHASAIGILQSNTEHQIASLRKDLTPPIIQGDPIKEAVVEAMKPYQIDFQGLYKEIDVLKKDVHYKEKKIENLYTLIDRLKEGKL